MLTTFSRIKLAAIGCLSITALASTVMIPTAHAEDLNYAPGYSRGHDQSNEDVRGYEDTQENVYDRREIYRRDADFQQVRNNQRLCLELRHSLYSLERTREALLSRYYYNPERLYRIERELRQDRIEYRRTCR
jgi:hypothetical protein